VGELVGAGSADAEGGVCAGDDDDFVFDSPDSAPRSVSVISRRGFGRKGPSRDGKRHYRPAESPAT